jgi:hypothetical protein
MYMKTFDCKVFLYSSRSSHGGLAKAPASGHSVVDETILQQETPYEERNEDWFHSERMPTVCPALYSPDTLLRPNACSTYPPSKIGDLVPRCSVRRSPHFRPHRQPMYLKVMDVLTPNSICAERYRRMQY